MLAPTATPHAQRRHMICAAGSSIFQDEMATLKLCISELMCQLLETRPFLWDTTCGSYHNRIQRRIALERILQGLGLEKNEDNIKCLKAKVKQIRTCFAKELRAQKASHKSGAGTDAIYKPKWRFFTQLQFLAPHCQTRPGKNNLDVTIDSSQDTDIELLQPLPGDVLDGDERIEASGSSSSHEEAEMTPQPSQPSSSLSVAQPPTPTASCSGKHTLQLAQDILMDIAEKRKRKGVEAEGEYYYYGLNLSKKLERLRPEAALECTRQIDAIVHGFLFESLHDK